MTLNQWQYGSKSEELVLQKYLEMDYKLIVQNFEYRLNHTAGRLGEIDLILEKDGRIYLVEVKARNNNKFGPVADQVNKNKMAYIYKTYRYFIIQREYRKYREAFFQFDLAIVFKNEVKIIPNAATFDYY